MLQLLLTLMLFIMPFLLLQNENGRPGLFTGLWVSLFFWGSVHPMFSILVFGISVICYGLPAGRHEGGTPAETTVEAGAAGGTGFSAPAFWVPRAGARPLTGFLAVMMIFCALSGACRDFGAALELAPYIQQMAETAAFAGTLAGPLFFGVLSDKRGVFAGFLTLMAIGLISVVFTASSPGLPYLFPLGILLVQSVSSGIFVLMPLILLRFYGRPQLSLVLPFLMLFLAVLHTAALRFYAGAAALPQDYLLAMVFLLFMAAPLAARAWRRRLGVL